jgi:glycosyltransferase involved in cell wall biosynthesis
MSRILRAGRYDAVCDFSGDFAAGSMWAARLAGVPTRMALYRISDIQYRPTLVRRAVARLLHSSVLWNATAILSNSRANFAAAFRPGELDSRCAVVYNGVDTGAFTSIDLESRRKIRRELGIADDSLVVGHIGRFTAQKAQDVLLRAFSILVGSHPDASLVLVGDGPLRPQVELLAGALGVADRVTFAGERHDVARMLHAMDLFVLPSRFEGCPNALLEAQAAGLPVVASDRPEIRESMPGDNHDCLAAAGDASALARKCAELLSDPARLAHKASLGAAFVRQHLDLRQAVEAFCAHLSPVEGSSAVALGDPLRAQAPE